MSATLPIAFAAPWSLLLLPLAAAPFLRRRHEELRFPSLDWIPEDRFGIWIERLGRLLAAGAIAAIVIALARPGRPESTVPRVGKGAEIVVLFDCSLSMDDEMVARGQHPRRIRDSPLRKRNIARTALAHFVERRPADRFAMMMFGAAPFRVMPFTQSQDVIHAGIVAAGISTGRPGTDLGRGLLAAVREFDQRAYTGSRVLLLVSDGAAEIDKLTRALIVEGLQRNQIELDWLYLRSANWPRLDEESDERPDSLVVDVAMHRFFSALPTPYHVFEAESPDGVTKAVNAIDRLHNLPLEYAERVPRRDYTAAAYISALVFCLGLLLHRGFVLGSWT